MAGEIAEQLGPLDSEQPLAPAAVTDDELMALLAGQDIDRILSEQETDQVADVPTINGVDIEPSDVDAQSADEEAPAGAGTLAVSDEDAGRAVPPPPTAADDASAIPDTVLVPAADTEPPRAAPDAVTQPTVAPMAGAPDGAAADFASAELSQGELEQLLSAASRTADDQESPEPVRRPPPGVPDGSSAMAELLAEKEWLSPEELQQAIERDRSEAQAEVQLAAEAGATATEQSTTAAEADATNEAMAAEPPLAEDAPEPVTKGAQEPEVSAAAADELAMPEPPATEVDEPSPIGGSEPSLTDTDALDAILAQQQAEHPDAAAEDGQISGVADVGELDSMLLRAAGEVAAAASAEGELVEGVPAEPAADAGVEVPAALADAPLGPVAADATPEAAPPAGGSDDDVPVMSLEELDELLAKQAGEKVQDVPPAPPAPPPKAPPPPVEQARPTPTAAPAAPKPAAAEAPGAKAPFLRPGAAPAQPAPARTAATRPAADGKASEAPAPAAPEPVRRAPLPLRLLHGICGLLDRPFRDISPTVKTIIGVLAIGQILLAIALVAYALFLA